VRRDYFSEEFFSERYLSGKLSFQKDIFLAIFYLFFMNSVSDQLLLSRRIWGPGALWEDNMVAFPFYCFLFSGI
jgi:hypothetical protein